MIAQIDSLLQLLLSPTDPQAAQVEQKGDLFGRILGQLLALTAEALDGAENPLSFLTGLAARSTQGQLTTSEGVYLQHSRSVHDLKQGKRARYALEGLVQTLHGVWPFLPMMPSASPGPGPTSGGKATGEVSAQNGDAGVMGTLATMLPAFTDQRELALMESQELPAGAGHALGKGSGTVVEVGGRRGSEKESGKVEGGERDAGGRGVWRYGGVASQAGRGEEMSSKPSRLQGMTAPAVQHLSSADKREAQGVHSPQAGIFSSRSLEDASRLSKTVRQDTQAPISEVVSPRPDIQGAGQSHKESTMPFMQADVMTGSIRFAESPTSSPPPPQALPHSHISSLVSDMGIKLVRPSSQGNTVLLQLHPPELGHLQVHVHLMNEQLTASFWAESPEVRTLLHTHLPILHATLNAQGFPEHHLSIALAPGGFAGHQEQFSHQHTPFAFFSSGSEQGTQQDQRGQASLPEPRHHRPPQWGLVDVVV